MELKLRVKEKDVVEGYAIDGTSIARRLFYVEMRVFPFVWANVYPCAYEYGRGLLKSWCRLKDVKTVYVRRSFANDYASSFDSKEDAEHFMCDMMVNPKKYIAEWR